MVPGEFEIRQSSLGEVFNSNLELEMEIDGKTTELFDDCILITDRLVLVLADNTDVGLGFHYIDFVFVDEFNQTIKKRMALGNSPSLIRVEH